MENLIVTESIQRNLLTSMKWLKFIAVLGAISIAILAIAAIAFLFVPMYHGAPGAVQSIMFIICGGLYVYPVYKAFSIVANVRDALKNGSQVSLEQGFRDTKTILIYYGILTIVALAFIAIFVLFSLSILAVVLGAR